MTPLAPDVIAAAKASHAKWRIPASVSLAQYALESGWGQHMPPASNNPFGIKARAGEPYTLSPTREVIKGHDVQVMQAFRRFPSIAAAFDAHGELLSTSPVYAVARAALPDPFKFADRLGGGTPLHPNYSTDPHYGSALATVIHSADLTRYDA